VAPSFSGPSHIGLTVRDRHASAAWYERTLGFRVLNEFTTGIPRVLMLHADSGFAISLYNHDERSGDRFNPLRTGLDHIALHVANRDQLDEWIAALDAAGVEHSPVRDLGHAVFVSLEDPDGIQFELWVSIIPPAEAFRD